MGSRLNLSEWRINVSTRIWWLIISGGIILAISLGFRQSLGLFLPFISTEMGIGRESFALGIGLMNLFWGLGAPITGAIADRYGSVTIIIVSGFLYALGLAVMTLSGLGEQLITGGILIGLGLSGAGFSVILGAVGRAAPENKRGLALGIATTGGSIGQFAALPYTHMLIETASWSNALLILAACSLIIVPLAFSFMAPSRTEVVQQGDEQTLKEAFLEACSTHNFWLLNAGFFVCGFHVTFIAVHLPAYLSDAGFLPWLGVAALTLVGLGNIFGSFLCGVLGDIYKRKHLLNLLYFTRAIAIAAFLYIPISETSVLVFSIVMGVLWLGTVPLTSGLIAKIYGTQYMSLLFGFVFLSHQVGGFLGAWLAGRLYDSYGNYDIIWFTSIALGIIAGVIHWPISERPLQRLAVREEAV